MKSQLLTNVSTQLKGKKISVKALSLFLIASGGIFVNGAIFAQKQTAQAASGVKSRTVLLDVFSAEALSKFDTGSHPDFYIQSRLDGVAKPNSPTKGNNNKPTFNYQSSQNFSADKTFVIVKVNLRDHDPVGKDERADINPSNKAKGIEMKYFPATGEIRNKADDTFLGRANTIFTIEGDSNTSNHKARITLRVSHLDHN
ncbi:MAG: hypothetical protein AAF378_19175 [Cyanobacteria bacterium P01_A01_bin.84]